MSNIIKPPLIIKTERLILRPFELTDLESTHEYASDKANIEYMVYLPNETKQETEQFLKRVVADWERDTPQAYEFAMIFNDKHIGAVSLSLNEDRHEGELGWILHKDYQHKGYATEVAKAALTFAIEDIKVKKVVAHYDYRNVPSYRIMQKIGLSLECDKGTRRNRNRGEDTQEFKYSLIVDIN